MPHSESVEWKLYRAKQNFDELEVAASEWFNSEPGKIEKNPDPNAAKPYVFMASRPIPGRFGLIAGDYLNNLRSVLDYIIWDTIVAAGKEPKGLVSFPVCRSPEAFRDCKRSRLRGVPQAARSIVEQVQPYPDRKPTSNSALSIDVLDSLNNHHKHRRPLITGFATILKPPFDLPFPHTEYEIVHADGTPGERVVAYLAFKNELVQGMEVTAVLSSLMNFVGYDLLPLFEPFF